MSIWTNRPVIPTDHFHPKSKTTNQCPRIFSLYAKSFHMHACMFSRRNDNINKINPPNPTLPAREKIKLPLQRLQGKGDLSPRQKKIILQGVQGHLRVPPRQKKNILQGVQGTRGMSSRTEKDRLHTLQRHLYLRPRKKKEKMQNVHRDSGPCCPRDRPNGPPGPRNGRISSPILTFEHIRIMPQCRYFYDFAPRQYANFPISPKSP